MRGIRLEFETMPRQKIEPKQISFSVGEKEIIDDQIQEFLKHGVIEKTSESDDQFVSNIFLRQKQNGNFRMILNLKELNKSLKYHHFKMDTLDTAVTLVTKDCFMISIDVKDAYYAFKIHVDDRKYLSDGMTCCISLPVCLMVFHQHPEYLLKLLKFLMHISDLKV